MTRNQVSHLIAARTGESLAVIRRLGFQLKPQPRQIDVGVDVWNFRPVTLAELAIPRPRRKAIPTSGPAQAGPSGSP